jgi:hypothetical protein
MKGSGQMKKFLLFIVLAGVLLSCYQAPLQWTENKDKRLFNTRWFNSDSSDGWDFDSFSVGNKRLWNEIQTSFQAYGVDMQWEAFNQCSLVIHAAYYLRSNPSMANYYHKSYSYSLSDSSSDSILTVNGEKYFFAGTLHD